MKDKTLAGIHDECCTAHETRIAELLADPVFQTRKKWVNDHVWEPERAKNVGGEGEEDT